MPSPYFVLSTWVALALQCLRLSMDLIQVASQATTTSDKEENNKNKKPTKSTAAAAVNNKNGYGSLNTKHDEEAQPLITITHQEPSRSSSSSSCCWTSPHRLIWQIQSVCALGWIVLVCVVGKDSSETVSPLVRPFWGWAALWSFLEAVLSCRDALRKRYGVVVRLTRWIAAVAMAVSATTAGIFVQREGEGSSSVWSLILLVVMLGTALCDDAYSVRLHRRALGERAEAAAAAATVGSEDCDNTADGKRKTMSRSAMLTLLKPYFWPDATHHTAFWNRVRAMSTWLFLIASKGCNLTAPLMVGQASTALAHQDYAETIRFSVTYAALLFFGVLFNEGKSLVYLKVAQDAFVQLSEAAFDHLHRLSLDWHLRKKLGEVLRGMDRGIAACDQLMKYLFLWLVPAFAECLVVTIIFASYFQYLPLALSVFSFVFLYIVWTVLVTLWRKKFRKALAKSDNGTWQIRVGCTLVGFKILALSCLLLLDHQSGMIVSQTAWSTSKQSSILQPKNMKKSVLVNPSANISLGR